MTTQEIQKRIELLEQMVAEFLEWKKQREQQQLRFPIDKATKDQIIFAVNNP